MLYVRDSRAHHQELSHLALAAVGDEENKDSALYEAALYDVGLDSAYLMTRCATEIDEKVLFTPNEVIFNCAASRSLFEYKIFYKTLSGAARPW